MPAPDLDPVMLAELASRFPAVEAAEDHELPALWASVVARMRTRKLIRTHTSVPAEFAEWLVARWLGVELSPPGTKDVDLVADEREIQVKALRFSNPRRTGIASFPGPVAFTDLIVVCFEYDMTVREALVYSPEQIVVRTPQTPEGLLTPANRRLMLGLRVRDAARIVPGSELIKPAAGRGFLSRT